MRRQILRAAERRRILHIVSSSIAEKIRFTATPIGQRTLRGKIEIEGRGFGGRRAETRPLSAEITLAKRRGDTIFSVWVTPESDTRIVFASRHIRSRHLAIALAALTLAGLAAGLPAAILATGPVAAGHPQTEGRAEP